MTRISSLFIAIALLAPVARAQDTFDLRALMKHEPAAGDRYRIAKEERGTVEQRLAMNGKDVPARAQKNDTASALTYVEEVLAVGADGQPTRKKRTLESFKDERGKDVDVTGIVVTFTRAEGAQGRWSFAAEEGSKALPPAVEAAMRKDTDEDNQRAEKGITEAQIHELLFPAQAQAVGGTWTIDVERLAPVLGMDAADLDLPASRAAGSVEGVEERDGATWVKAKVTMTLAIKRMQGQPLAPPAPLELTLTFALPAEGGVALDVITLQHLDMTMSPQPGASVHVLMDSEVKERRSAP